MVLIGNILWFVLGGFWLGLEWVLSGVLCFCTIIGIPYGVACFRIAGFAFFPFGRTSGFGSALSLPASSFAAR